METRHRTDHMDPSLDESCRSQSPFLTNVYHTGDNPKAFFSKWVFTCLAKLFFLEKDFPHAEQTNAGFFVPDEEDFASCFKTRPSWTGISSLIPKALFATEVEIIAWSLDILNLMLAHSSRKSPT